MQLLMGAGRREGCFWSLHYFLKETHWTVGCDSGVSGILPSTAKRFGDRSSLLSPLQLLDSAKWGGFWNAPSPANWGKPARLTRHRLSLAKERVEGVEPPHACQLPTPRGGDRAVLTKFWTSAGIGSAPTPSPNAEMNYPAPRIMGPLSQQRNKVQNLGAAWSFLHLAQGSLWKKRGKITGLLGLKKWPADRCLFFLLSYSMVIRNIVIKQ